MNNYVQPGEIIELTAPTGGVVSGLGYLIGSLFVVATVSAAQGAPFNGLAAGVVSLPKTSAQAWTEGQRIYWDAGNNRADNTGTVGFNIGVATAAAINPSSTGRVRLNGGAAEFAKGTQAANPDTSGATLANLEIEVNEIKAALRAVGIIA